MQDVCSCKCYCHLGVCALQLMSCKKRCFSFTDKNPDHFPLKNLISAYTHSWLRNFSMVFAQIGLISFKLKVYSIQTKTIQAILVAFNSPLSSVSTLAVTFLLYVLFQLKMTSEYFPFQLGRKDVLVGICLFGSILCRFAQGMRWVSVSISGLLHCNPQGGSLWFVLLERSVLRRQRHHNRKHLSLS